LRRRRSGATWVREAEMTDTNHPMTRAGFVANLMAIRGVKRVTLEEMGEGRVIVNVDYSRWVYWVPFYHRRATRKVQEFIFCMSVRP